MADEKFYLVSSSSNLTRLRKAHILIDDVSTKLLRERVELFLFKAMQEERFSTRDRLTQFAYQMMGELERRGEDIKDLNTKFEVAYHSHNM